MRILVINVEKSTESNSNQHMTLNIGSLITISIVTNDHAIKMNYDSSYLGKEVLNTVTFFLKLTISSGRSAAVIETLLHDADLKKAGEENKKKVEKGKEIQVKIDEVRKLNAMLDFNMIGCQVGKDSLLMRMKMAWKKKGR